MENASDSIAIEPAEATTPGALSLRMPSLSVHGTLALCCMAMLVFCVASAPPGAKETGVPLLVTALVLLGPLLVPAAYWHQHHNADRRDAALMLPWAFIVAALIAQTAVTAATFTYPLRDSLWRSIDQRFWISVPAIMAFTARHPSIQELLDRSYGLVHPLMLCAIFLPALMGKREAAERFLLSNALGFVLALPLMIFVPAVGPWVAWNFEPSHGQYLCGYSIHTLRAGRILENTLFGATVCLPSFHVFWAVVAAYALQAFRWLRVPTIILAVLIVISTVSTGWHYAIDVIVGLALAALCIGLATAIVPRRVRPQERVPER